MNPRLFFLVMIALFGLASAFTACVPKQDKGDPPGPGGPGNPDVKGGGGGGGVGGAGFSFDLKAMSGRKTQKQIAGGEHVTIAGEIQGECAGNLRIDIIEPGFQSDVQSEAARPLCTVDLEQPGAFSVVVPTGVDLSIGAACDGDKDGVVSSAADSFVFPTSLNKVWADQEGVTLVLSALGSPKPPPVDAKGEQPPKPPHEGDKPAEPLPEGPPPDKPAGE